jgi:hypothetical protein
MSFFDLTDTLAGGEGFRFIKGSDKKGLIIQFYHVPTLKRHRTVAGDISESSRSISSATFKAFLTNFKDNYKVNWSQKETFGRMDAIQSYKNTQRQISVSFDVPSHSIEEANLNFAELQKLIMMQYPTYETIYFNKNSSKSDASTTSTSADRSITAPANSGVHKGRFISSPPLLYVRFLNWIKGETNQDVARRDFAPESLVGVISEVSFNPDLEDGFYFDITRKVAEGATEAGQPLMTPKLFRVDLNITVIHTEELGWVERTISGDKMLAPAFGEPKTIQNNEYMADFFPYKNRFLTGSINSSGNQSINPQASAKPEDVNSILTGKAISDKNSQELMKALAEVKPATFDSATATGGLQLKGDIVSQPIKNTQGLQQINRETDAKQAETDIFNMLEANQAQNQQKRQQQRQQKKTKPSTGPGSGDPATDPEFMWND